VNKAPQRAYIPQEDAMSPTVLIGLTFITVAVVASKKQNVRCYNIPSAFVNTDVDEHVCVCRGLRLRGGLL
jgi:hypothetical protein